MRHRVKTTTFNRDTNHRKALLRNGVENLLLRGAVVTSSAKAKEFKRWADKLIHQAQEDTTATRRDLHRFFGKRAVVNTLVDQIAPAFTDRNSGFTRMVTVGKRRGDNMELVRLELVVKPEHLGDFSNPEPTTVEPKVVKKATVKKTAAPKKAVAKKTTAKKPAAKKKPAKPARRGGK